MKKSKFNTKKRTKISGQKRKVKISRLSKKKQFESQIQEVFESKEFDIVQKTLSSLKECKLQTREQRRLFMAKIYCHINASFNDEFYKRGIKTYLLRLFPVKIELQKDGKEKDVNQPHRNKYSRALRLLRNLKVPSNEERVLETIKKLGLQDLFNGKITDEDTNNSSKSSKSEKKKSIKQKNSAFVIKEILSSKTDRKIGGNFVLCCINSKSYLSQKEGFAKELVSKKKYELELVKEEKSNDK